MSDEPKRIFPGENTGALEGRILVLEAACAAMRDLLQKAKTDITVHRYSTALRCIDKGLATDAGKAMLERLEKAESPAEKIQWLAEGKRPFVALADHRDALERASQAYEECAQVIEAQANRAFLPTEPMDEIRRELINGAAAIRAKAKEGT